MVKGSPFEVACAQMAAQLFGAGRWIAVANIIKTLSHALIDPPFYFVVKGFLLVLFVTLVCLSQVTGMEIDYDQILAKKPHRPEAVFAWHQVSISHLHVMTIL